MSFLSIVGKFLGVDSVKEIVSGTGKAASNLLDRWVPKKMTEVERMEKYIQAFGISESSTDSARQMFMAEMRTQKQPWVIKMLNGFVRPFGGIGALSTEFFVIWGKNLGVWFGFAFTPITLTVEQHLILGAIIAFYFGTRLKETLSGVTSKR